LTIPRIDTTAYATTEAGIDRLQRVNVDQPIAENVNCCEKTSHVSLLWLAELKTGA
jgi:hypothetical protein